MKIVLSDLEKHLFPERYPYFNAHFKECEHYINQAEENKKTGNVSFITKLSKLSLTIKNEAHRAGCNKIFEQIVEQHYNWKTAYNWQDLKLILFCFVLLSKTRSLDELKLIFSKPLVPDLMKKYQPKHAPLPRNNRR